MRSMINMTKAIVWCGVLAGLCLCIPAAGRAFEQVGPKQEEYPFIDERGSIGLGVMHAFLSSQIQINRSSILPGTFIDFEKDLGLEGDQVRFFGDVNYRVSPHSSFRLTYVDISRQSTKTLDRTIEYGDRVFSANSVLDVSIATHYYLLAYRYSFVRNTFVELGASAGFNIADISSKLQLNTLLTGPERSAGNERSKETGLIVPVPLVGVFFSAQVLPNTFLQNSFLYIDGEIGEFSIKSFNYIITLDYSPWSNVAFGIGAYTNRLQIDRAANIDGKFVSMINSPLAYARYYF